ncbi:hypothetical protein BDB00DRAFT_117337 [Zychaea mexicana]|uniref:uncharacterized protein n=1 Tax=Zychaea mexicana TaxID=64656 RepID=UPI0022FF35C8|nr:uncharacterized protein BDB00DRAFT_117337 [Zychaea mexicana]KAI9496387.1 hypothetical protein BDB00DRAFT_117337 [Zychaea mexicana]
METINTKFFQTTFTEEVVRDLHLRDFWLLEEPCHWTLTHYLESLVKLDPAVSNRNASIRIRHDAKIIQEHVVAGTVAETMVTAIVNYPTNARGKKIFQEYFKHHTTPIGIAAMNFETQKSRLRSIMSQVIADEEEINMRKRNYGESSGNSSKIE